jgi:hypothetical protein
MIENCKACEAAASKVAAATGTAGPSPTVPPEPVIAGGFRIMRDHFEEFRQIQPRRYDANMVTTRLRMVKCEWLGRVW